MCTFTITTLVENCVYNRKLQAEHGLSLYIRTPEYRLLFDTGQSDLLLRNAELLHIDLQAVDYLILSHGHSDHTGGLHAFLEYNRKAKVLCKREVLNRKFKKARENGLTDIDRLDLSRFCFIDKTTELGRHIVIAPNLPISNPVDTHFDLFYTEIEGERVPDRFDDECALFLTTADTFSVISACSHRGITNVIAEGQRLFPDKQLNAVVGGFHIHTAGKEKFEAIADTLKQNPPRCVGVCHCTGVDQYARFAELFPEATFYNHVGKTFQLPVK